MRRLPVVSMATLLALTASVALAQTSSGYSLPPKPILDVLLTPSPPQPLLSPTEDTMLLVSRLDYPSIARVSAPYLRLAGVRVETGNHSRHDTRGGYGITPCAAGIELVRLSNASRTRIELPGGSCPGAPVFAADGRHFAFANTVADSVELWIGDIASAKAVRMPGVKLNPMFNGEFQWMADQRRLLVKLVPDSIGAPPPAPTVPDGPAIQESTGKGQSSTYETRDTLSNSHDEALFDYYAASQLALVDSASAQVTPVGPAGNYDTVQAAPDGLHVLVRRIHRPYSYVVTYERFPHDVEVWDVSTPASPTIQPIAQQPLADRVPIHGEPTGVRDIAWRQTDPATLVWPEALDGGDWNVKVAQRDKVMMQKAPFDAPPVEWLRTEHRFEGFVWGERRDVALLQESDANRNWQRVFVVDVDAPQPSPRLLFDQSSDERYANPGRPAMRRLANGASVIRMEGDSTWWQGTGSSPDGDRPFLDRRDIAHGAVERLFRSGKTEYEQFLGFGGKDSRTFLTWRQSITDVPNAWRRTLGKPVEAAAGEAVFASGTTAITRTPDPAPAVRAIKKQLIKYKRADGLELSATLYTPPGYKAGTRVPTILYAYPRDYADAAKAGQVTGSQYLFTQLRQYRLLLLAGYAIIDNAAFPIVGDPKRAYDDYMPQLVADAKAAVDEAVRLGVTDPDRVGVTGHSHGALMTANLVAHSDLFRAGVATSGAYNKVLTPFGFQSERRSLWNAPEVYRQVSPYLFADTIKVPLLLIHGDEDANPGTTPLQSKLFFEAIRGNGGTTRLVMLPHEPHWYTALESQEQQIYEMVTWFDRYVKDAPARAQK
ncbi:S9 family peptidase [soil metagenome]